MIISHARYGFFIICIVAVWSMYSCSSNNNSPTNSTTTTGYDITDLVADTTGYPGVHIDATLANAWGIAIDNTGVIWVCSNHGSVVASYNANGIAQIAPIIVPARDSIAGGAPAGAIENTTTDFSIPLYGVSSQIFSSEDGIITARNNTVQGKAVVVAKSASANAVYKGIALGASGGANYIYATDFKEGKIDVYNASFAPVQGMSFSDPNIPAGYGPFGIDNINGKLYVTYAKLKPPDNQDDQAGPGYGYVDVFNTDGSFVKRFATQGTLNSPWAVALAPAGFGDYKNSILVGNFGDGTITAFDTSGNVLGQLKNADGSLLAIDGLWGLTFSPVTANTLYFTAGPAGETYGLFGYIKAH